MIWLHPITLAVPPPDLGTALVITTHATCIIGAVTECSIMDVQGEEQVDKSIKMGKLFPILFFIHLIFPQQ